MELARKTGEPRRAADDGPAEPAPAPLALDFDLEAWDADSDGMDVTPADAAGPASATDRKGKGWVAPTMGWDGNALADADGTPAGAPAGTAAARHARVAFGWDGEREEGLENGEKIDLDPPDRTAARAETAEWAARQRLLRRSYKIVMLALVANRAGMAGQGRPPPSGLRTGRGRQK